MMDIHEDAIGVWPNVALNPGTHEHAATGEAVKIPVSAGMDGGTCKRVFIEDWLWECSACKSRWNTGHLFNYCPTCGRKLVDE